MAISTTINIVGYSSLDTFFSIWFKSYLAALPFAMVFSPIMTLLIKPRIEKFLA